MARVKGILATFIVVFWIAIFGAMLWVFKAMLEVSEPGYGVGVVGGAVWAFVAGQVVRIVESSINDARDEWIRER